MAKASQVVLMENEFYLIKAPNGKVLEVKNFNTENGAAIRLWDYAGHPWHLAAPVEPQQRAESVLGAGTHPQRPHPHPERAG